MRFLKAVNFFKRKRPSCKNFTGLTYESGERLYHLYTYNFNASDKKLLEKENVFISEHPFSKEEDEQLRKNWEIFLSSSQPVGKDIFSWAGFSIPGRTDITCTANNKPNYARMTFWGTMCSNLENRTAAQIQERIALIFDPFYTGEETLTDSMKAEFESRFFINLAEVAGLCDSLKVPFALLLIELPKIELRVAEKSYPQKLFEKVIKRMKMTENEFVDLLAAKKLETINSKVEELVKWKTLICKEANENDVKNCWNHTLRNLTKAFDDFSIDNETSDTTSLWTICRSVVFGKASEVCDPIVFVRCFYKTIKENTYKFSQENIDIAQLKERLRKVGFDNWENGVFRAKNVSSIMFHLRSADKEIFKHMKPAPTLKEKVLIYFESKVREKFSNQLSKKNGDHAQLKIFFDVACEYYYMRYKFKPPPEVFDYIDKKYRGVLLASQNRSPHVKTIWKDNSPIVNRIRVRVLNDENEVSEWSHVPTKRRSVENKDDASVDDSISISESIAEISSIHDQNETRRVVTFGGTTFSFPVHNEREEYEDSDNNSGVNAASTSSNNDLTNISLSLDESVLAGGGGKIYGNIDKIEQDSFTTYIESKSGYDSLIIEVPKVVETKTKEKILPPALPSNPTNNWLDIVNMFN